MRKINRIPAEGIQNNFGNITPENPCFCCGSNIKNPKYYVHLLTDGDIVDCDDDLENSQGLFPIGKSCKNTIPKNFIFKK